MSLNSSSPSNDSLHHPNISSNKSHNPPSLYCFVTRPGSLINTAFYITNVLALFPICILVLYLGLQRWWRQPSSSTGSSHPDTFTYHMVAVQLLGFFGYTVFCCGIFQDHVTVIYEGYRVWTVTLYGELFFHLLTCVDRYLAVVQPITYLSLRRERGIRIRYVSIGCVWLLSYGRVFIQMSVKFSFILEFFLLISSLILVSFCSLSVLSVLIRPGPGQKSERRKSVDQSKQRAFYTIMAILGVLLMKVFWNLLLSVSSIVRGNVDCVLTVSSIWFNLPSSLVLPLLFLHRAGVLVCCKNNSNGDKN